MAAISTNVVRVEAAPWSDWEDIDFDLIADDIEDYYFVYDTGDNATAFNEFYRKSGAGNLLTVAKVGTTPSIFYEDKAHRFSADDTHSYGAVTNSMRAITVAHFSATNPNGGYKVTAPADTGERKLVIYGALYAAAASHMGFVLDLTLNDGSSTTASVDLDAVAGMTDGGDQYFRAEITYTADADSSTIDAEVLFNSNPGSAQTVAIQVAGGYVTTAAAPTAILMDTTTGSYSLAGSAASTLFNHVAQATAGAYSQDVSSAKSLYSRVSQAVSGSYSLSGVSASTVRRMVLSTITGSFTGAYASAQTLLKRVINTNSGAYAVTGANAKLNPLRELVASAGGYVLSGVANNMITINKIAAAAGAYVLSAFSVDMAAQRLLHGGVGGYAVTGASADTSRTHNAFTLKTTTGVYAISGTTTTINHDVPPPTTESVLVQMRRKGRR